MATPILYSFRRCPYAMRARMALFQATIQCEIREVLLKNKPDAMLTISSKGTVPVLQLKQGNTSKKDILDESIDIMLWALSQSDPDNWLTANQDKIDYMLTLIEENDADFKHHLDRYKYPDRYDPKIDAIYHRGQACLFLNRLESRLQTSTYLFGDHASLADIAIFPFIRQFAAIDRDWFAQSSYPALRKWLQQWLEDARFHQIMHKLSPWQKGDKTVFFLTPQSHESCD